LTLIVPEIRDIIMPPPIPSSATTLNCGGGFKLMFTSMPSVIMPPGLRSGDCGRQKKGGVESEFLHKCTW